MNPPLANVTDGAWPRPHGPLVVGDTDCRCEGEDLVIRVRVPAEFRESFRARAGRAKVEISFDED